MSKSVNYNILSEKRDMQEGQYNSNIDLLAFWVNSFNQSISSDWGEKKNTINAGKEIIGWD